MEDQELSIKVEQQVEGIMREEEAPCRYFSAFPPSCSKGHLSACRCDDYQPQEQPGDMEPGLCIYEWGHVVHLTKFANTDGFYRRCLTFCNRAVDEALEAVEIYEGEPPKDMRICSRCLKEKEREQI